MSDVQSWIKETVTGHSVVLFMKGTAQFPQCGFSGRAIELLTFAQLSSFSWLETKERAERWKAERAAVLPPEVVVAAEARGHVRVTHARADTLRHLDEQLVASGVAERVVHSLEAVEIEAEHRKALAAPRTR